MKDELKSGEKIKPDIFRDTHVRYLGYANEIGEAFRAQVHVNVVRFSYLVASSYVTADAVHKGGVAAQKDWESEEKKRYKVRWAVIDTLVWQGLASVVIPGFTINRVCALSAFALRRSTALASPVRKWITTAIGLTSIPFIIKPIDKSVDFLLEATLRKYYHAGHIMETVVHHRRDD